MQHLKLLSLVLLSTSVFAEGESIQGQGMSSIIMFGLIFVMMYFLMIRPQSKKAKEHRNLISNLDKDDEIITSGGLVGKIVKKTEQFFIVSIAEGVEITIQRQAVTQALPKGTIKTI